MLIAVPTGVKIFNWIATMFGGSIRLTTSMLFAVAFLLEFTIGGLSGMAFAAVPVDWQMTDTYFVSPTFTTCWWAGRSLRSSPGLTIGSRNLPGTCSTNRSALAFLADGGGLQHDVFCPALSRRSRHAAPRLHLRKRAGMGRAQSGFNHRCGDSFAGVLLFVANVLVSLRFGAPAGVNPWDGWTLEWSDNTSSVRVHSAQAAKQVCSCCSARKVFSFSC